MVKGLYTIAKRDKKEREMDLMSTRERAEHAARVKTEAGTSNAATGGEAGAAKDAAAPGSGDQAAADATKETEGIPTDATDENLKGAQNLDEVANGAGGAGKGAETVATGGVAGEPIWGQRMGVLPRVPCLLATAAMQLSLIHI